MKLTTQQQEQIKALTSDLEMDLLYHLETSEAESIEDLTDELNDNAMFDIEVIYYANAIELLREHDPSLKGSCGLASEMGYETENLSSEILASILASGLERQEYHNIETELEEILFPDED